MDRALKERNVALGAPSADVVHVVSGEGQVPRTRTREEERTELGCPPQPVRQAPHLRPDHVPPLPDPTSSWTFSTLTPDRRAAPAGTNGRRTEVRIEDVSAIVRAGVAQVGVAQVLKLMPSTGTWSSSEAFATHPSMC